MTVAEQLEARGEARGEQRGDRNARLEVAASMLKEGTEPRFVAKMTKLELADVEKLKADLDTQN